MAKSKRKTHKSAVKRFKLTGTGKVTHRSHRIRHKKATKSKSQMRRLLQDKIVTGRMGIKIKKLLGEA